MTSDEKPSILSDIDYMKSLAEAGEKGPLNIGRALFWAGIIYGVASLVQYGMIVHIIPYPNPWFMVLNWGVAILISVTISIMSPKRRAPGSLSASNRAAYAAWSGVGLGVFAFMASVAVLSASAQQLEGLIFILAPAVLVIYGVGWWVCARMSGQNWLTWVSIGCFVAAPMLGLFARRPEQLVAYAVCLFVLATLPGYKIMQDAKQ
jgi:hypothetical protein